MGEEVGIEREVGEGNQFTRIRAFLFESGFTLVLSGISKDRPQASLELVWFFYGSVMT